MAGSVIGHHDAKHFLASGLLRTDTKFTQLKSLNERDQAAVFRMLNAMVEAKKNGN
jgi:hypothetical protein